MKIHPLALVFFLIGLSIGCAVILLFHQKVPAPQPAVPGRYQLFVGARYILYASQPGQSGEFLETNLFRIDTTTGTTWMYRETILPGITTEVGWSQLSETNSSRPALHESSMKPTAVTALHK